MIFHEVEGQLRTFSDERDWEQVHTPTRRVAPDEGFVGLMVLGSSQQRFRRQSG